MVDLVVSADSVTYRLPADVRARQAADLADRDTEVGGALSATFATLGVVHSKVKADASDESGTLIPEIEALCAAGGGTLLLPVGHLRADSQIDIPFTLDPTGAPQQPPIRLVGAGAWSSGRGSGVAHDPYGGTNLDLRYDGAGAAKILTRGFGRLEITGMTITDFGLSSLPFLKTTNTVVHVHGNAFIGNPSKKGTQCDQDAIVLGGSNVPASGDFDLTDNGPFQGYGSIIEGNWFNRIRRIVHGQVYSNGSIIRDNTAWQFCGSNLTGGACIEINPGASAGSSAFGNVISSNLIEVANYPYGILIDYAQGNTLSQNNFYDQQTTTLAYIRMNSANAKYNTILAGYGYVGGAWQGGVYLSEQTVGVNTLISGQGSVSSQFVTVPTYLTGLKTNSSYSRGVGVPEITLGAGYSYSPGIFYLPSGATPNGVIVAGVGSLCVSRAGGAGTTLWVKESAAATSSGWASK